MWQRHPDISNKVEMVVKFRQTNNGYIKFDIHQFQIQKMNLHTYNNIYIL